MEDTDIKKIAPAKKPRRLLIANASGKGGIGKSIATCLLGCAHEVEGRRIKMYDADNARSKTKRMFGDAAEHYKLHDLKEQSKFFESIQDDADVIIHDTGASYDLAKEMSNAIGGGPRALSEFFGAVEEMEVDVTLLHMLTYNPETTFNIGDWLTALEEAEVDTVRHVICLNKAFVDVADDCPIYVGFEDPENGERIGGNTRDKIINMQKKGMAAEVFLPKLHPVAAAKMEIFPMRYSMAMQNKKLSFAERMQVKVWFDNAYDSFREAGSLLGFPEVEAKDAA